MNVKDMQTALAELFTQYGDIPLVVRRESDATNLSVDRVEYSEEPGEPSVLLTVTTPPGTIDTLDFPVGGLAYVNRPGSGNTEQ